MIIYILHTYSRETANTYHHNMPSFITPLLVSGDTPHVEGLKCLAVCWSPTRCKHFQTLF